MAFIILTLLLGTGAVIPVIVNFIQSNHLSWSLYSLGAVIMAWLIIAPWFVFTNNRLLASWGVAVFTLPLFLWLVESLAPAKGWLLPLGLPAAALGLAALGGLIGMWFGHRVNCWYAVALTFLTLGILSLTEYLVARPFLVWEVSEPVLLIIALCVGGVSITLLLIAFLLNRRHSA